MFPDSWSPREGSSCRTNRARFIACMRAAHRTMHNPSLLRSLAGVSRATRRMQAPGVLLLWTTYYIEWAFSGCAPTAHPLSESPADLYIKATRRTAAGLKKVGPSVRVLLLAKTNGSIISRITWCAQDHVAIARRSFVTSFLHASSQ